MHGIGEYRWADGRIYKGSWANDDRNGMGLLWYPNGSLYQGNYKVNKRDGLQIIHSKATGNTADAEYQHDLLEGLFALHKSDGIVWYTHSKD
jgi:hypothetical protein